MVIFADYKGTNSLLKNVSKRKIQRIYPAFSIYTAFQGNQNVDEEKFFIEEFQPVNKKGMIELENYHLVIPNEVMDLGNNYQ